MKVGITLPELAAKIQQQHEDRVDYKADTRALTLIGGREMTIQNGSLHRYGITDHAHRQIASYLGIPARYYDMLQATAPDVLDYTVEWFFNNRPEKRMVRTLDGEARAFLSERYRRLDNWDVAEAALPVLLDRSDLVLESCEITETRMYIKATFHRLEREVKLGDVVRFGVTISNSEVGCGAVSIKPFSHRLVCTNGMIIDDLAKRKYHLGRFVEQEEDVTVYGDDTMQAEDRAFTLRVRDTLTTLLKGDIVDKQASQMRIAAGIAVEASDVPATVEVIADRFKLNETERGSVLNHLIGAEDFTGWGYANAMTRTAQDVESYDRATEIETFGGSMISWTPRTWLEIGR